MNSLTLLLAFAGTIQGAFLPTTLITKRGLPTKSGWTVTFAEEFKGTAGTLPNQDRWIIDTGTQYAQGEPRWGNNEVETYTKNRENIELISPDHLKMTPRKSSTGAWTSSRIETKRSDFAAKSGGKLFIESRMRLGTNTAASQQGIWPSFWALGAAFRGNYHNWPQVSEWDIMEVINGQTKLYSTAHCGVKSGGPCNEPVGLGSGGANTVTRGVSHIYGFQIDRSMVGTGKTGTWKDETITWYLDGKQIYQLKGATVKDATAWDNLAHKGHFLLLNVAVGGNWAGAPNAKTLAGPESGLIIDYVGVWNK